MRLRFPWFTLYAEPGARSRARCFAAMVVHEALHLVGIDPHRPGALGYRSTLRYSIGVPATIPPRGLRTMMRVIGNDVVLTDVPVVDGGFLFVTDGASVGVGASGKVVAMYRGNAERSTWDVLSTDRSGIRVYDAGLVTIAELLTNGPKLIFNPGPNRMVMVDFGNADAVPVDGAQIGVQADVSNLVAFQHPISGGWTATSSIQGALAYPPGQPYWYEPDEIFAFILVGSFPVPGPVLDWAALTAFADNDLISVQDTELHVQWLWSASGVVGGSGASIPTFDQASSPVTDGGITWSQVGQCPTTGTAHIFLWVADIETLP